MKGSFALHAAAGSCPNRPLSFLLSSHSGIDGLHALDCYKAAVVVFTHSARSEQSRLFSIAVAPSASFNCAERVC